MAADKNNIIIPKINKNLGNNFIAGFLGVNKCGKSTTMREKLVVPWLNSRKHKLPIYGHDPQHVFDDLIPKKNLISSENKHWAVECNKLRNCFLILQEINMLCPTPQHPPKGVKELFSQCFYRNVNIIWEAHNPALVPPICKYHTTKYYIYLLFTTEGQFEKNIPCSSFCIAGSNYVNKYVKKYTRGRHRLDPLYNGQDFVYALVDVENQTLIGVNMDSPL